MLWQRVRAGLDRGGSLREPAHEAVVGRAVLSIHRQM